MARIEINVEDAILHEADKILHSLGMNAEIAINIFLRRIALEKGLPMSMAVINTSNSEYDELDDSEEGIEMDGTHIKRINSKITSSMVEEVWRAFLKHLAGDGDIKKLSISVSDKSGMNQGSAFIYLFVLINLVNGDSNTRILKYKDLEMLMSKIRNELGEKKFQKALHSLDMSVPYWREKIPGNYADKVAAYVKKHLTE